LQKAQGCGTRNSKSFGNEKLNFKFDRVAALPKPENQNTKLSNPKFKTNQLGSRWVVFDVTFVGTFLERVRAKSFICYIRANKS
jgi:hypothetical protein